MSALIFTRDLRWIFRELPVPDIGIDALVEVVSGGEATGDWIALQVKSGESFFREKLAEGFVYRGDADHLEYWLNLPIPTLLVLCSSENNRCWWQPIDHQSIEYTGKGWKTFVPLTNELGSDSVEPIRAFVRSWQSARGLRGLPAEDELSVIFHWLGRCKLVHKLPQSLYPPGASDQFQVPDLLAAFEVDGTVVPVLVEVTDFSAGGIPIWEPAYVDSLQHYAKLLGLPLLIALKYVNLWALFEVRHLRKMKDKLSISFPEALSETLLGLLAGDFSFSFFPGVGIHIKIRKLKEKDRGFEGLIEDAYFLNAEGEKHSGEGGIHHLFACIEQEVHLEENETHVVQSFVIPADGMAEFAHRAVVTLLATPDAEVPDWHQILAKRQLPLLFVSPHEAAREGVEAHLIRKIVIHPRTKPTFMSGTA